MSASIVLFISLSSIASAQTYKLHQGRDYLDIDGDTGAVIYWGRSNTSGTNWSFISQGNGVYKITNMGESKFNGWYLDIDGNTCVTMLSQSSNFSGTNWTITQGQDGLYRIQNKGGSAHCAGNLKNSRTQRDTWSIEPQFNQ